MPRQCLGRRSVRPLLSLLATLPLVAPAPAAEAQIREPRVVRWWEGAIAVGGVGVLMVLDRPVQRFVQARRSEDHNAMADVLRAMGQPEVYVTLGGGLLATGILGRRPEVARAGARVGASLAVASAAANLGKLVLGRPRPRHERGFDELTPFSGNGALPSGHTAMAFALATALADEIRRPWAAAGLYGLAAGTAWSRLNDNDHWFSDVTAGAVLGVVSSKLVTGRWRIPGFTPPAFLYDSGRPVLTLRASF